MLVLCVESQCEEERVSNRLYGRRKRQSSEVGLLAVLVLDVIDTRRRRQKCDFREFEHFSCQCAGPTHTHPNAEPTPLCHSFHLTFCYHPLHHRLRRISIKLHFTPSHHRPLVLQSATVRTKRHSQQQSSASRSSTAATQHNATFLSLLKHRNTRPGAI